MKLKIIALALASTALTNTVQAEDLIRCTVQSPERTSTLRVYETPQGYAYEAKGCREGIGCEAISGPISRPMTPNTPAMVFKSDKVSIIHLFGMYVFSSSLIDVASEYYDDSCVLSAGDDFVSIGEVERAPTGACPAYNITDLAKRRAVENAEKKCSSRVLQIGDYKIDTTCNQSVESVVARSIFRCIH